MVRFVFRPKMGEVGREWRISPNKELNDLYESSGIISIIKWRLRWDRCIVGMKTPKVYRILVENALRIQSLLKEVRLGQNIMLVVMEIGYKGWESCEAGSRSCTVMYFSTSNIELWILLWKQVSYSSKTNFI